MTAHLAKPFRGRLSDRIDHPFSVTVFLITSLGVGPFNWFFVVRSGVHPLWQLSLLSLLFVYGAALASIPAGASLKRYFENKVRTPAQAIWYFSAFLLFFVCESLSQPLLRVAWVSSAWLSVVSGVTFTIQLLVTSYLQKIVWDRAVKLVGEQALAQEKPPMDAG